jgi:hypothetical protein
MCLIFLISAPVQAKKKTFPCKNFETKNVTTYNRYSSSEQYRRLKRVQNYSYRCSLNKKNPNLLIVVVFASCNKTKLFYKTINNNDALFTKKGQNLAKGKKCRFSIKKKDLKKGKYILEVDDRTIVQTTYKCYYAQIQKGLKCLSGYSKIDTVYSARKVDICRQIDSKERFLESQKGSKQSTKSFPGCFRVSCEKHPDNKSVIYTTSAECHLVSFQWSIEGDTLVHKPKGKNLKGHCSFSVPVSSKNTKISILANLKMVTNQRQKYLPSWSTTQFSKNLCKDNN